MIYKNQKLILVAVSALLIVGFGITILGFASNNNKTTITVAGEENLPVTIFSQEGYETTQDEQTFTLQYTSDTYLYRFVNPSGIVTDFYDIRNEDSLSVVFSNKEDKPPLTSIEDRLDTNGLEVKTIKGYENDKWVIASAVTPNIESDGSIGIYVLESGSYVEIFSGTGPDLATLLSVGVPENIALNILEDYSALSQI